jgi:hypothetical protein
LNSEFIHTRIASTLRITTSVSAFSHGGPRGHVLAKHLSSVGPI